MHEMKDPVRTLYQPNLVLGQTQFVGSEFRIFGGFGSANSSKIGLSRFGPVGPSHISGQTCSKFAIFGGVRVVIQCSVLEENPGLKSVRNWTWQIWRGWFEVPYRYLFRFDPALKPAKLGSDRISFEKKIRELHSTQAIMLYYFYIRRSCWVFYCRPRYLILNLSTFGTKFENIFSYSILWQLD